MDGRRGAVCLVGRFVSLGFWLSGGGGGGGQGGGGLGGCELGCGWVRLLLALGVGAGAGVSAVAGAGDEARGWRIWRLGSWGLVRGEMCG